MKKIVKIASLLLLMWMIGFSPHFTAEAEAATAKNSDNVKMKAFCWGTKGDFKTYVNSNKDDNGFKISNFAAKFNYSNSNLTVLKSI